MSFFSSVFSTWTLALATTVLRWSIAVSASLGLAKPVVFGYIVATVGCYYGLSTKGGTQGVGRSTTEAVVAAMILIIAVDVFVTRFLMAVLGA